MNLITLCFFGDFLIGATVLSWKFFKLVQCQINVFTLFALSFLACLYETREYTNPFQDVYIVGQWYDQSNICKSYILLSYSLQIHA